MKKSPSLINGVLPVDKPAGMTSHDVVARIRRLAGTRRVGHAGTLDPDATGVLLVCIGTATRIADLLADEGKAYRCGVSFGSTTSTEDASGTVLTETDASVVTEDAVTACLPGFIGDILQVPPMVSAVHHEGKRLYELARAGVTVERAARPVRIDSIVMEDFVAGSSAGATLTIRCGKGTYIRTLCADLGDALGVGAHMAWLRRTAVGTVSVDECVPLDTLTRENIAEYVISAASALRHLPLAALSERDMEDIGHGRSVECSLTDNEIVVAVSGDNELVALARVSGGVLKPFKVFAHD